MYTKLIICSLICALVAISFHPLIYQIISPLFTTFQTKTDTKSTKLLTSDELKLYNGVDNAQLYLAVLGKVYDVSTGAKYYGPDASYNSFIGRDASRSFITGKFDPNDVSDEVADLPPGDLRSLDGWLQFYKKNYRRIGKLIGRYYDSNGKLTSYGKEVKKLIKTAYQLRDADHLQKQKYPPCNVEWSLENGSKVWCSTRSGGISRDWVGVPRQLYEPGSKDYRCACLENGAELSPNLKPYPGCDEDSDSCFVKE